MIRPLGRIVGIAGLVALSAAGPAHALKVATWNLLGYDDSATPNSISPRQASFRTVIASMDPDVIMAQELNTASAADSFLNNVLNVVQPGQWVRGPFLNATPPVQSCVFWKSARLNVTLTTAVNVGPTRQVLLCVAKPLGYVNNNGWFRIYSMHLKAGNPAFTPSDSTQRRTECNNLRNAINSLTSQGPNFVLGGDTNFYSGFEPGYIGLTQSISGTNGNAGRCYDIYYASMVSQMWNSNPAFAAYDTQSPCAVCNSVPNLSFSGGGMDDRFDIIFTSYSLADGQGVDRIGYTAFGQDGLHYNTDINDAPTNAAVGQTVADALWAVSDHLPVVAELQLASRVVAASQLDFGSAIVGGTAQRTLQVSGGGTAPVDALDYSFTTVPTGFTAPSGSFSAAVGVTNPHTLGMSSATAGVLTGTLVMTTDDPDSTAKNVKLSGTVLDHAQPSLDAVALVTADTLDWGDRSQGSFGDSTVTVSNPGYGPLRARLQLSGATVTGGSGRFGLVGASFPALVAGTGVPFTVHFDDTGASTDTTYEATLTFATGDEPLPGATTLTPLTVTLRAHRVDATGVGDTPRSLAFLAPRPNPLTSGCALGFELPRAAGVELAVYDLSGRRVATLASGDQPAGRHLLRWDAVDDAGTKVGAGIYFARFRTAGMERTARMVVLP